MSITPENKLVTHICDVAAALVAFIVTAAYKNAILASPTTTHVDNIDPMWRLLIGLGCVPGVVALYFRLTIPETPRFTMDIERNIQQATADIKAVMAGRSGYRDEDAPTQRVDAPKASWSDFARHFGKWENGKVLFGTAYSWFALDVSYWLPLSALASTNASTLDCILRPGPKFVNYFGGDWFRYSCHKRGSWHLR